MIAGSMAQGYRRTGYIEFAFNSPGMVGDAGHYFPAFYHFDRMLHQSGFTQRVRFDWEIQPAAFIDASVNGFTCTIFVNTYFHASAEAASHCWASALSSLATFLSAIPVQTGEQIY